MEHAKAPGSRRGGSGRGDVGYRGSGGGGYRSGGGSYGGSGGRYSSGFRREGLVRFFVELFGSTNFNSQHDRLMKYRY